MIHNLILIIIIIIISSFFAYYLSDFLKLKYHFKEYFNTITELKKSLTDNNKLKDINIQKKLDNVSLKGIKFIFYTFKFLIPYFVCYVFLRFLKVNFLTEITLIIISSFPYLIIFKKKK